MDILSELTTFKAEHAKLAEDYKAANELLEASQTESMGFKAANNALQAELNDAHTRIASLGADLDSAKVAITALQGEAKTAEARAIELVSKQGVAPIKVDSGSTAALSKDEVLAEYKDLLAKDSYAAGKYYAKHKKLIFG